MSGKPCRFLVDQGATLTVLRRGLLPDPPPASPALRMRNAGSAAPLPGLYGPRRVQLSLHNTTIAMQVYEGEIHDDCLLGGDFIAAYVETLEIATDTMVLRDGGARVPMTRVTTPPHETELSMRVETLARTVIRPGTSQPVAVHIKGCGVWDADACSACAADVADDADDADDAAEVLGGRSVVIGPNWLDLTLPATNGLATHSCREGRGRCTIPPEPWAERVTWTRAVQAELRPAELLADQDGRGLCVMVHNTGRRAVTLTPSTSPTSPCPRRRQ